MFLRTTSRTALLSAIAFAIVGFTCLPAAVDQSAPPPKKVAILIFNDVAMIDYSGPYEVFSHAGYNVYAVAASKQSIRSEEGLEVVPKYSFADAPQADIVVIPGGGYEAPSNAPPLLGSSGRTLTMNTPCRCVTAHSLWPTPVY